jgi:hypothetical protein
MPIVKAQPGRYCDMCKAQWGKVKNEWHEKAKTQAVVVCVSETHLGQANERAYCDEHRTELSTWHDGTIWSLADQMEYGRKVIADIKARKAAKQAEEAVKRV